LESKGNPWVPNPPLVIPLSPNTPLKGRLKPNLKRKLRQRKGVTPKISGKFFKGKDSGPKNSKKCGKILLPGRNPKKKERKFKRGT